MEVEVAGARIQSHGHVGADNTDTCRVDLDFKTKKREDKAHEVMLKKERERQQAAEELKRKRQRKERVGRLVIYHSVRVRSLRLAELRGVLLLEEKLQHLKELKTRKQRNLLQRPRGHLRSRQA